MISVGEIKVVIASEPGVSEAEMDMAARIAITDVVANVIIPEAAQNAPGSVGSHISMGQVLQNGVGDYAIDLYMPKRYQWTETGSGVFADGSSYVIAPKVDGGVLHTADDKFIRSAEQVGQQGQFYLSRAIQAHTIDIARAVARELKSGLARRVAVIYSG